MARPAGGMSRDAQLIAHMSNGMIVAMATLVQMLERRGRLEAGAYLKALKDTINEPDAAFDRPDYIFVNQLATFLEGHFGEGTDRTE